MRLFFDGGFVSFCYNGRTQIHPLLPVIEVAGIAAFIAETDSVESIPLLFHD